MQELHPAFIFAAKLIILLKTILHIVGNRPQFIKLAVLHKEIAESGSFSQKIIHTGQHYSPDMSGIFFSELNIPPIDFQLECKATEQPDAFIAQTSVLLQEYFVRAPHSLAFVYGDTNTTLAAAIAAWRSGVPLFHFESGIRTGEQSMPEEINRILTDRLAHTNYCCTSKNYSTMIAEGYGSAINSRVLLSGDLMLDAFLRIVPAGNKMVREKEYVVATIHRQSNILSPLHLTAITKSLNEIHKEMPVVMPLHPHTKKRMEEYGMEPFFLTMEPLGYSDMKRLLLDCSLVITDSGGLSREAFFSKKKSVIVMENPFWPEIIEAGCSINVPADASSVKKAFHQLPSLNSDFSTNLFGDGNAAGFIKEDLLKFYN